MSPRAGGAVPAIDGGDKQKNDEGEDEKEAEKVRIARADGRVLSAVRAFTAAA